MAKPDHVDLPAEAVKTVRCLVSYLKLRRSLHHGARSETARILQHCTTVYAADVDAMIVAKRP